MNYILPYNNYIVCWYRSFIYKLLPFIYEISRSHKDEDLISYLKIDGYIYGKQKQIESLFFWGRSYLRAGATTPATKAHLFQICTLLGRVMVSLDL